MDARTRDARAESAGHQVGDRYPVVFGAGALDPATLTAGVAG